MNNHNNIQVKYLIYVKLSFYTHHSLIDYLKFHNATERKNKQNAKDQDHDCYLINDKNDAS